MKYIYIENEDIGKVKAELLTEKNPKTCEKIWQNLPLDLDLSRWGKELYGSIPVEIEEENSQEECEIGDIGYWLSGSGFCIFFGKTPASTSEKPKAASPINVFAKIVNKDPKIFDQFSNFKGKATKGK
ncbi:MAG: cyclophilin-like fold protein [Promethearchaeia archaeon]